MEYLELPLHVPRPESHLFRYAIIASQSGKHLASVFYLRSFVEQFARRVTGIVGRETSCLIATIHEVCSGKSNS